MKVIVLHDIIRSLSQMDENADVNFVSKSYVLSDDIKKIKETNYATVESSSVENINIDFRKSGNRITIRTS